MSKNRPKKEKYTKCSVCGEYSNYIEFDKPLSDYICDVCKDREDLIAQAKLEAKIEVLEDVVKSLDEEGSSVLRFGTNIVGFAMATAKVKNELSNLKKEKK